MSDKIGHQNRTRKKSECERKAELKQQKWFPQISILSRFSKYFQNPGEAREAVRVSNKYINKLYVCKFILKISLLWSFSEPFHTEKSYKLSFTTTYYVYFEEYLWLLYFEKDHPISPWWLYYTLCSLCYIMK